MLFPAFLIGSAFGMLIIFVLSGTGGVNDKRPLVFSVIGSAAGVAAFLLTADFWPPVVGPFILCPAIALTAALATKR